MSTDGSSQRFGRYELLDRLGRGGMADVWRARVAGPQGFARTLVIKRILPHLISDSRARELFEREARVASRLSHANIVPVYEFGEIDGEYYLAMEYVDGCDLSAIIRAGGASPHLAAAVVRDVCRALSYAHALRGDDGVPLRILHRDVSPSNVMIGYDGSVRLLDFGIAKAFSDPRDKRTMKGTIRGKFGYIAPEVFEGHEPDARADIFSLGVVLHETVSGKRLFRGASDLETVALVKRAVVPLPSSLHPGATPALDEITMCALERDREQRFHSAAAMADALDPVVHELRFGPKQLADLLERLFPRAAVVSTWQPPLESGAHTVRDTSVAGAGHGTARVDDEELERETLQMDPVSAKVLAQEVQAKLEARRAAAPAAAAPKTIQARAGNRPMAVSNMPVPPTPSPSQAPTFAKPTGGPPGSPPLVAAPPAKKGGNGIIWVLTLLLVCSLAVALVLLKRRYPAKFMWLRLPTKSAASPATPPTANPATAAAPPDLAKEADGDKALWVDDSETLEDLDGARELAAPSLKKPRTKR